MNGQSTAGSLTPTAEYKPPKMWKDLSVEEKLERIREEVKNLGRSIYFSNDKVEKLENDFKNHDHLNGKVVKDIKTLSGGFGGVKALHDPVAEAKGEVYF